MAVVLLWGWIHLSAKIHPFSSIRRWCVLPLGLVGAVKHGWGLLDFGGEDS